ncbi:hypothetical protein BSZ22_19790 [Bradyrhizobium canariense]|uniref:Signal transduction histidine kinase subgroup 2 dimerisation and phosphoacceptor domain-containing protein n=1 Tax=Bradyrhizobium canariense TaxID=255045 RepID=A0A1X3EWA7_9BRAD|nr:hypothetical protein BST65_16675 [Bradyrhizobium canariense]OSI33264.1 hypothetical protein BST66_14115 [Bradyrhizobium canariense]OSI48073.1 hypothetical protein BSZ20_08025 [Bradyrhizobium canariense]OSI48639.1 hypothetical protein BST67_18415 [Bradyrhizobium canariense]OSI58597.1 hypothetical protein BSZ15_08825 [Bradyrhizobium canariense]
MPSILPAPAFHCRHLLVICPFRPRVWNCCDSRGRRSRHDVPHTPAGLDRRGTFCSRSSHIERGNDLATIVSILRLQARSETDPGVQRAIASAVSRVDVAKVHDRLRETADTSRIALAPDIESLCASLADFHRGVRTISIRVRCEDIWVRSSQAASIGLIVNELLQVRISGGPPRLGGVELRAKETHVQGRRNRLLRGSEERTWHSAHQPPRHPHEGHRREEASFARLRGASLDRARQLKTAKHFRISSATMDGL